MRASFRPLSKLSTALKQTSFTSTPATLLKPGNQTTISINPWHYTERIGFYVRQLSPAAIQAAHATRLNLRRTTTWPFARFAAKYPTNRKPTLYLIGKLSAHSISQGLLLAAGWCLRASERLLFAGMCPLATYTHAHPAQCHFEHYAVTCSSGR